MPFLALLRSPTGASKKTMYVLDILDSSSRSTVPFLNLHDVHVEAMEGFVMEYFVPNIYSSIMECSLY